MHTNDMGVLPNLVGSTLAEFMLEGPRTHKENLANLWNDVLGIYGEDGFEAQMKSRISAVTKEMLGGSKGIFYKVSRLKAAELRHLVPVLLELLRRRDTMTDRDGHRILAFEAMAKALNIVHTSTLFLSATQHAELKASYTSFLEHYHMLREIAAAKGLKLYNITFKFHGLLHTIDYAKWCNPSAHWCYGFEDFMGKIVRAAQSCSHATPPQFVGRKVVENYQLALHLQMSQ